MYKWKCSCHAESCELKTKKWWVMDLDNQCPVFGSDVKSNWKLISETEEPTSLKATDKFPKNMAEVLRDAPIEREEFQREYEKFVSPEFGIFSELRNSYWIEKLQKPEHKKVLDYALEKGWVKRGKPKRVINVGANEKVGIFKRGCLDMYVSWLPNEISKIEIEDKR